MGANDMTCDLKNRSETIDRYLKKELTEPESDAFEAHFLECTECFDEVKQTRSLADFIAEKGEALFPEFAAGSPKETGGNTLVLKPRWKPALTYSLVAAAAIILVFVLYRSLSDDDQLVPESREFVESTADTSGGVTDSKEDTVANEKPVPQRPIQKQKAIKKSNRELYAANYVESPDLENVIGQAYRNGYSLDVLGPKNGTTLSGAARFVWKTDLKKELTVKILSNGEKVLIEDSPGESGFLLDLTAEEFTPGLYYWKLETEDDLLHVGKFFID